MSSIFINPDKMRLTTKLNAIAAQENNDGEEYDLMVEAAIRIKELEAERDAANAVAKAYVEQVDELEAKLDSVETEIDAMEIFEGNASRDCCCDEAVQWYAARLRALLGKENDDG